MIKKRIDELLENNMIQHDLAVKLNKADSTIGLWEQGRRELDYETLTELSNLFDVSIDYILGRTNNKSTFPNPDIDDFAFALYDETKELTDEQKQDIMDMVKKMKEIMRK